MQKKIIALAIAAAISAPAFADTTVYGVADVSIESTKNSVAGSFTQNGMADNASRLGVKGSEDLGNGMSATYQFETAFNPTGAGFGAARNSGVGIKGNFGAVVLGNWDTPFKTVHNKLEMFDNAGIASTGSGKALLGRGATLRAANSISYTAPDMGGVAIKAAYSMNPGVVNVAKNATVNPDLLSFSVAYDNAGIYAALGYQAQKDMRTPAVATKDDATRLVGAYTMGDATVGLTYEKATAKTGAVTNSSVATWEIAGKYDMGSSNIGAAYVMAGNNNGVANTGANQLSLKYGYAFSKRTEAYALYTQISNKTASTSGFNAAVVGAGSKDSGFGVGLRHTF
jgi:predicted porin